jgi:hypothetical protein
VVTASDLPAGDVWPFSSSADSFFVIMNMALGGTLGAQRIREPEARRRCWWITFGNICRRPFLRRS